MASAAVAAVAWSLAGLICFIGTFLCCCCKDILSTAPKLIPQSMGNPPGNVPPPPAHKLMQAPSPPVTYAMPAPQPAMMMYPEVSLFVTQSSNFTVARMVSSIKET
jgi:hypothetical protein